MPKIVFVNRYFYPDHSATSQILSDLAFFLSESGYDVCVVTSRLLYDDTSKRLDAYQNHNGVKIYRIWTSRFGRFSLYGRGLDYVTFYISSFVRLLVLVKKADLVVAKTDPPLISVVVTIITTIKKARQINWLQDLFPEVATTLGIKLPKVILYFLTKWRNASLKHARCNVVLGEKMKDIVVRNGVSDQSIRVITNWQTGEEIRPRMAENNQLRSEWGLADHFVVGYSGNLGRAHDVTTICSAMNILRDNNCIRFLFIGGGVKFRELEDFVRANSLDNVVFKSYQPIEKLDQSINVSDVHLISLLPELEGLIVPSKFYGIIAAGKPAIFIGDYQGELADIIKRFECGEVIEVGDSDRLVNVIVDYSTNRDYLSKASINARRLFKTKYAYPNSLVLWEKALRGIMEC